MSKEAKTQPKRRYGKLVLLFWAMVAAPFAGIALALFLISQGIFFEELPTFEQLENPRSNQASVIYSSDGEILGKYYRENRNDVYYQDLSPHLVTALISTEDERYRNHSGVDLRGLARAIAYGGGNGGASTITQQLAKMLFHNKPTGKVGRIIQKLKEWIIAVRLERQYTKEEILTMYLNKFDFINNAVGVRSAAQVYFGTTPDKLELHEAAMLIGMAKNPSLFNPIRRPDTTLQRRNVVFYQMMRNEKLSREEFDSLKVLELGLDYHRVDHKEGLAPYFREELRRKLGKMFSEKNDDDEYVYSKPDGSPYNIYRDGIRVYTTIDSRMQKYAEYAVQQHLGGELQADFWRNLKKYKNAPFSNRVNSKQVERIMQNARKSTERFRILAGKQCANCGRRGKYIDPETIEGVDFYVCNAEDCGHKHIAITEDSLQKNFDTPVAMKVFSWNSKNREIDTLMTPNDSIRYYKSFLQAGFMAMDPHNGHIKAWVGGPDYNHFRYDHVHQSRRQVGSTIKPFVYTMALKAGLKPCTEVPNIKQIFHLPDGKTWSPGNADGKYGNTVSLRFGLANSLNPVTAYIFKKYGTEFINTMKNAGITSKLDPVPALCLGVADISIFEMVGAYSTFANRGQYVEPIYITRIEDKDGRVIREFHPEKRTVIDEETAYTVLDMMKGVVGYVRDENGDKKMGTGIRIRFPNKKRPYAGINHPMAGKTGTTQNNSDGWFMGITPDLVAGAWVGAEDRSISFSSTYYGQGANTGLPIYGYFMKKVYGDKSIGISTEDFEAPDGFYLESDCQKVKANTGEPDWE